MVEAEGHSKQSYKRMGEQDGGQDQKLEYHFEDCCTKSRQSVVRDGNWAVEVRMAQG